jgi:hypothetical protein
MVDNLARTRTDLTNLQETDPQDPLIRRECFFTVIDWDNLYQDLLLRGAALPQRVYWHDVVTAIQSDGAGGALRLLEVQLEDLHASLCSYLHEVEAMRNLQMPTFSYALHNTSLSVSVLVVGFTRILVSCACISMICERRESLPGSVQLRFSRVSRSPSGLR